MPTFSTGPGIYVNETALKSISAPLSGESSAAVFFGTAERGTTDPVLLTDWASYRSVYGELKDEFDLGYAVYHFFNNGGRRCYVIRVVDEDSAPAQYQDVQYFPNGTSSASANLMDVAATGKGAWGNSVRVLFSNGDRVGTATSHSSFNMTVYYNGVEVEKWTELSVEPDSNRFVERIVNNYSKFISVSNTNVDGAGSSANEVYNSDITLDGGTDSNTAVGESDYSTAYTKLDYITGSLILNAVGRSDTVVTNLISKAESRGDSFVVIDPSPLATSADLITSTIQWSAPNSSYAAYYAPMLKMADPAKSGIGAVRDTYPGGAVAGVMIRTDVQRSVSKAPAGYAADLRGALGTVARLTPTEIGTLYSGTTPVNVLKAVPGGGVVINGARTLARQAPDKFIPVRRTLNYLKASLKAQTEFALFEPNDANLWDSVRNRVSAFLAEFYRSGGLSGRTPSEAFYVICDSTNNTAISTDQGVLNLEVGVSLLTPAEFIVINISQWTGGSSAVDNL